MPNAQHADLIDLEESNKAAAPPSSPRKERSRSEESLKPRSESDASKKRLSNKFEKLKTQLSSMSDHEIRTVVVAQCAGPVRPRSGAGLFLAACAASPLGLCSQPINHPDPISNS